MVIIIIHFSWTKDYRHLRNEIDKLWHKIVIQYISVSIYKKIRLLSNIKEIRKKRKRENVKNLNNNKKFFQLHVHFLFVLSINNILKHDYFQNNILSLFNIPVNNLIFCLGIKNIFILDDHIHIQSLRQIFKAY